MLKWIYPIIISLMYSCASISGEWGQWKVIDVAQEKQIWRLCEQGKDGIDKHHKGFCYISQECRKRETILGNERIECRNAPLFCTWGDIDCYLKNGIFNKQLTPK